MKKKMTVTMVLVLALALFLGALAPLAFAEGKGQGEQGETGNLPPELQEYQGKVQEALATLQEPIQRVRSLAGELKEGRGVLVSALRDQGDGAARAFAGDLRSYVQEARGVLAGLKEARSGVRGYRGLKRQVVQAVRAGDTGKAIEIIEGALAKVDEARAGLEQLASDLEALKTRQAELLDRINGWTPPESGQTGVDDPAAARESVGPLNGQPF
jgi:hypothetical protein